MAQNPFLSSPFEQLNDNASEKYALPKAEQPRQSSSASDNYLPPAEIRPVFEAAAKEFNVPVNVLMALGHQESRYNAAAVGQPTQWGRAKGMMQYLDSTAKGMGINPFDPAEAIPAAAKQIRERLDKGYSMEDAVKEHFSGPDRKLWGEKTKAYGQEVMAKVGRIGDMLGTSSATPAQTRGVIDTMNDQEPGRYRAPTAEELEAFEIAQTNQQQAANRSSFRASENQDAEYLKGGRPSVGGTLLESLKSGAMNLGANIAFAPEAVLKSVNGALEGLNNVGRNLGLPEWMLERKYVGPTDIIAPLIEGKDFGSYHMAGTSDFARMIEKAGKAIESPKHAAAIKYVANRANNAVNNALATGDFNGVVDVLSDPESWAVAFGQAAPSLAVAMVGGLPAMAAMEGGGALSDIKEFEKKNGKVGDLQAANTIIQTTAVNTLLEKLGLDAMMGKLPEPVRNRLLGAATDGIKGRLLRGLSGGAVGAVGESTTEMAQTVNENLAKRNYDSKQSLSEGVLLSGMGGGASGGPVGVIRGVTSDSQSIAAQVSRAIDDSVNRTSWNKDRVNQDVIDSLNPNPDYVEQNIPNVTIVGTEDGQQVATATPAQPSQAAGPLSRAVENAADQPARVTVTAPEGQITGFLQSTSEDSQGNTLTRVLGDDGQVYNFTSADNVQIKPEVGPLTGAVEKATDQTPFIAPETTAAAGTEEVLQQKASEQAAKEAAKPKEVKENKPLADVTLANEGIKPAEAIDVTGRTDKQLEYLAQNGQPGWKEAAQAELAKRTAQPAKAPEQTLETMTEPELRDRLKYIANQAKSAGGWNKMLIAERRKVEAQINKFASAIKQETTNDQRNAADLPVRNDQPAVAPVAAAQPADQQGAGAGSTETTGAGAAVPGEPVPGAGANVSGADSAADAKPALGKDLSGAKPRYAYGNKQFDLTFASDIDRAAYIAAQKTPSKRDADYVKFVSDATGMTEAEVRAHGAKVRDAIKAMAKDGKPGTLKVPEVARGGVTVEKTPAPAAAPEFAQEGNVPSRQTLMKSEAAKRARELEANGKSTVDDPLVHALYAIYNPMQANDKDAQLHALNYGEENGRADIVAEAKANLTTLADKLEREAESDTTTPAVPETSPKYQKIKSDLEARKAKKGADAAEIRARLSGKKTPSPKAEPTTAKPKTASKEDLDHLFGVDKKRATALKRIESGTAFFGTKEKAKDFITNNGLKDTHEVVQTGKVRFEVMAKQEGGAKQTKTEIITEHRVTDGEGKPATLKIKREKADPSKVVEVKIQTDGERMAATIGSQGVVSDEQLIKNLTDTEIINVTDERTSERQTKIDTVLNNGGKVVDGELRQQNGLGVLKLTDEELAAIPDDKRDTSEAIKARLNAVYGTNKEQTNGAETQEAVAAEQGQQETRVSDAGVKREFTYKVKPTEGGFLVESDDGGGVVMAGRPNGPGVMNTVPPRVFKTEAAAREYMQKKGMTEAQSEAKPVAPKLASVLFQKATAGNSEDIKYILERRFGWSKVDKFEGKITTENGHQHEHEIGPALREVLASIGIPAEPTGPKDGDAGDSKA